ncbi:hypothetical protein [Actinoallomurus iriomotensis]|uniref:Uncharacterized protein n=1 Tax=Actinoallomurus iriomotensis TaxID=478107 RepID=A0A9W6W5X0_9ACTN|nr:hypothetical protein [Actinoallomurus iriomotensis]GLY91432.1 hypothetical protein Airi02_093610 [Actinoallomurus iriomotensis]
MGEDQRTLTADQTMLGKTEWTLRETPDDAYDAHVALTVIEFPATRAGLPTHKGYGTETWESDPDFRTQHFSQRYSRLLYSLYWADQRISQERFITADSLRLMGSRYTAAEDQSLRAVFDVPLPPKLTD